MCAVRNDRYPHVFSPLKIRGVTLNNRLEYSPTAVLKCTPEGDVTQEMLDYVEYQAKTGVAYLTIGNTPVVHTGSSAWLCELNVIVGLECAIMLGMEGKSVTVIDMIPEEDFGKALAVFNHIEVMYQLEKYGVALQGDRRVTAFEQDAVVTVDSEGNEHRYSGDTFVLALEVKPDDRLLGELRNLYAEGVYAVGDCVGSGRLIADANQDGFHAAIRIR